MKKRFLRTLTRLWTRYNPRRIAVEVDANFIEFASQMGYITLYRGEWMLTPSGEEWMLTAIKAYKENHADVRS